MAPSYFEIDDSMTHASSRSSQIEDPQCDGNIVYQTSGLSLDYILSVGGVTASIRRIALVDFRDH